MYLRNQKKVDFIIAIKKDPASKVNNTEFTVNANEQTAVESILAISDEQTEASNECLNLNQSTLDHIGPLVSTPSCILSISSPTKNIDNRKRKPKRKSSTKEDLKTVIKNQILNLSAINSHQIQHKTMADRLDMVATVEDQIMPNETSSIFISDASRSFSLNKSSNDRPSFPSSSEPLTQFNTCDELQKKQEECENLLQENALLNSNINELNSELDRFKEMYDLALQEIAQLKCQATKSAEKNEVFYEELKKKFETEILSFKSKLNIAEKNLNRNNEKLNLGLQEKNSKIKLLEEQNNDLIRKYSHFQFLISDLKTQEIKKTEAINEETIEIKNTELDKKLEEKSWQQKLDECINQKLILEKHIKKSNTTISKLLLDIQNIITEKDELQLSFDQLNAKFEKLNPVKSSYETLEAEYEFVKTKLDRELNKNEKLKNDFKVLIDKKQLEKKASDLNSFKVIQTALENIQKAKQELSKQCEY